MIPSLFTFAFLLLPMMIAAVFTFTFLLLPYAVAFALLAFLPRWQWLVPVALAATSICTWVGQKVLMPGAPFGANLNGVLLITVGFGFTAGFIARASLLIAQAYRPLWASPKLILPITFVATPFVIIGLTKIV